LGNKFYAVLVLLNHELKGLHENLLNMTIREAQNGAKIIFWHESNGLVFKKDEVKFIEQTGYIAKKYNTYIMILKVME